MNETESKKINPFIEAQIPTNRDELLKQIQSELDRETGNSWSACYNSRLTALYMALELAKCKIL